MAVTSPRRIRLSVFGKCLAMIILLTTIVAGSITYNAVGLLHWEMRAAQGLIMEMATAHRLPAGGALHPVESEA